MGIKIQEVRSTTEITSSHKATSNRFSIELITRKKLNDKQKERFFSELHVLLSSGLDIGKSFVILMSDISKKQERKLIEDILNHIIIGKNLSEAVTNTKLFSPIDSGVLRIGEETGRISDSLNFLSDYYAKRNHRRKLVTSALSYPAIVFATAILVVFFMLTTIVPMFEQVYARFSSELPPITKTIISISKHTSSISLTVLVVIIFLAISTYLLKNNKSYRRITSELILRIPIIGSIVAKTYQATFCNLMYLLSTAKVPILDSINLMANVIHFYPYQQAFIQIQQELIIGIPLSQTMAKHKIFEGRLVALVRVGEEVNKLDSMFEKLYQQQTTELEHRIKIVGNILEPILIIVVGIFVAFVLVAMYLPMFRLGTTIN